MVSTTFFVARAQAFFRWPSGIRASTSRSNSSENVVGRFTAVDGANCKVWGLAKNSKLSKRVLAKNGAIRSSNNWRITSTASLHTSSNSSENSIKMFSIKRIIPMVTPSFVKAEDEGCAEDEGTALKSVITKLYKSLVICSCMGMSKSIPRFLMAAARASADNQPSEASHLSTTPSTSGGSSSKASLKTSNTVTPGGSLAGCGSSFPSIRQAALSPLPDRDRKPRSCSTFAALSKQAARASGLVGPVAVTTSPTAGTVIFATQAALPSAPGAAISTSGRPSSGSKLHLLQNLSNS
mmetsp:Transcript_42468/g.95528  ORF Transcript_42468/g.95528 Transcript_42468/m.95528 type:complete len:295 (+) Transcript_42468:842-1726(+)